MHHYGEDAVEVTVTDTSFFIVLTNHNSNAKVTITGPNEGIFEDPGRKINQKEAEVFGANLAHFFRQALM